jgi:ABC-type Na+ efflux pump permease subunit
MPRRFDRLACTAVAAAFMLAGTNSVIAEEDAKPATDKKAAPRIEVKVTPKPAKAKAVKKDEATRAREALAKLQKAHAAAVKKGDTQRRAEIETVMSRLQVLAARPAKKRAARKKSLSISELRKPRSLRRGSISIHMPSKSKGKSKSKGMKKCCPK